ncbi:unnamed protein product [Paramecium octaurelia]|uniref:Uncharacterized protein n=1 Tax=Paramecium octaurelia TaxID=43137 RepID=A0A8S1UVH2_PAROT|nr:unnamed protein product [Paramecium octaurelia]
MKNQEQVRIYCDEISNLNGHLQKKKISCKKVEVFFFLKIVVQNYQQIGFILLLIKLNSNFINAKGSTNILQSSSKIVITMLKYLIQNQITPQQKRFLLNVHPYFISGKKKQRKYTTFESVANCKVIIINKNY